MSADEKQRFCAHGKPLYANPPIYCRECEIIWVRDCLDDAVRRVASCNKKLRELEAARRPTGAET